MVIVAEMWSQIQGSLFPHLRETLDSPLTEQLRRVIAVLEVVRIEEHWPLRNRQWMGRTRSDRRPIARAFVTKAVCGIPTTEMLIERLQVDQGLRRVCGWERRNQIPSAATFSRSFAEFATMQLGEAIHEVLVRTHVGDRIVGHINRDSTEIEAREKPVKKEQLPAKVARKRGRPKRGEIREQAPKTRLVRQSHQTAEEAIAELPILCDVGMKRNSKGHSRFWIGYKLHLDVADGGLPIFALTTSASLHDSQVAIPMSRRTSERVHVCYELMDAAYDARLIHQFIDGSGRRAIIDSNPRTTGTVPFDPATAERFKERTTVERAYSRLKDEFGGRYVRVRGHPKVHMHLMFGVLALFADQALRFLQR
jgi:hypothetical protein